MRKTMSKEITTTNLKIGKIELKDGHPIVKELPDMVLIGEPNERTISKELYTRHGAGVSIYKKEVKKAVYEMEVERFMKLAKLKGEEESEKTEEQPEETEENKEAENQQREDAGTTIITRGKRG